MNRALLNPKRLVLLLLSMALIVAISISITFAFFTGSDKVKNTFVMGSIKIEIDEPNWNEDSGLEILPGKVCKKDPTVTAEKGKSYMRIRMEIVDGKGSLIEDENRINLILNTLFYDETLTQINENKKYTSVELQALVDSSEITKEYNRKAFKYAGNESGKLGVRYYNYIANDGVFDGTKSPADVATLFTNVVIPRDWNNQEICELNGDTYTIDDIGNYQIDTPGNGYKILISAEAIQISEMPNAEKAFETLNNATNVVIDN